MKKKTGSKSPKEDDQKSNPEFEAFKELTERILKAGKPPKDDKTKPATD